MKHSLRNSEGFTLLEFLVAIVIIAVGLLALLQSINLSLAENLKTMFRNQAVMLADERMTVEKTKPFDCISTTNNNLPKEGHFAFTTQTLNVKGASMNYSITTIGSDLTTNTKNLEIDVTWNYKGKSYSHALSSLISQHQ